MARTARRKKSSAITVDFEGVESGGGGGFHIPEGPYKMKLTAAEDTESEAGNSMFKFEFTGQEKKAKGKKFYIYCVYDPPDSLWKLRSLLEALGQEVPDGPMDIDLEELLELELIGHVEDDEYRNKTVSRMNDFSSIDGDDDAGEEEEEEEEDKESKKRSAKKTAAKKARGKKELEAVSADEVKAMDDDELAELVEKYELDVDLDEHKTPRRKTSAVIAALEEKELLGED